MARLRLVSTARHNGNLAAHRASASEGEAAAKLLESQGYEVRGPKGGPKKQYESRCPFHEGPGALEPRKGVNFYVHAETSQYFCQSASCGEKGNLQLLERHFGVGVDEDEFANIYKSREDRLREFELNLTTAVRTPFYEHGLSDVTIERFRLGFDPEHTEVHDGREVTIPDRYVIPYLEGRRPRFFRYYAPYGEPKYKYTWEAGAEATLFNASDGVGDKDGNVFLAEGELKCALLCQLGYAAVAVPGASQWKDEWQAAFKDARKIFVVYDNDNPLMHVYDKPEEGRICQKCRRRNLSACIGHNPGQEAAIARVEQIGWRARNVLLPPPDDMMARKTDVNDYFVRDGGSNADFFELATGKRATPYAVSSFAEIRQAPPDAANLLIEQGILTRGGRLLVAGKPKAGKSLFINNMALSLASGKRFLGLGSFEGFAVDHPTRTLLLDRELSKRSLFDRLDALIAEKPGFRAAEENLLIDHDHLIRLDQPNAYEILLQLIEQNGVEVCILDTAYKFFAGDVESSASLMKAFGILDRLIAETDCAFVLTHHHKKNQNAKSGQNNDVADPDNVAGSFLWTGWPNASILLNFLNRSVENPFNAIATFTAFRDAAPPDPLALYRDRSSISYRAIEPYHHESEESRPSSPWQQRVVRPTTQLVETLLLESAPCVEEDFLHMAAGKFGVSVPVVKPYYIDAMARGSFTRSGQPPVVKFAYDTEQESWEAEHGLREREMPDHIGQGLQDSMFAFEGA